MDPNLQRNILKFGYGINNKFEGQLSHSVDRFFAVMKVQLPRLIDISVTFKNMPVDYKNCDYLSPHNSVKYFHLWREF